MGKNYVEIQEFKPEFTGALSRALYEEGGCRLDLPLEDPYKGSLKWLRLGLTADQAERAKMLYKSLSSPFLRGERLARLIAEAVKAGEAWLAAVEEEEETSHVPLDGDGDPIPLKDGGFDGLPEREAVRWRKVYLEGEESLPESPVPPELESWWHRVREHLMGPLEEAHKVFRTEVRRHRRNSAWINLFRSVLYGAEIEPATARIFRRWLPCLAVVDGKVRAKVEGVEVELNPLDLFKILPRRMIPAWTGILLRALARGRDIKKVLGRLDTRELEKENLLSQVYLPPLASSTISSSSFSSPRKKEEKPSWDEKKVTVARSLWLKGQREQALRWLRAAGLKVGRNLRWIFCPKDLTDLHPGLAIRQPRSKGEAQAEERRIFNILLSLNWASPSWLTTRRKLWLWRVWWPYTRKFLAHTSN